MAENMSLADQAVQALAAVKAIGAELTNDDPERHQVRLLQRLAEAQIAAGLRQAIDLAYMAKDLRALVKELEGDEPRYTAQEVADACVAAEIPDSKCESLLLALKA